MVSRVVVEGGERGDVGGIANGGRDGKDLAGGVGKERPGAEKGKGELEEEKEEGGEEEDVEVRVFAEGGLDVWGANRAGGGGGKEADVE